MRLSALDALHFYYSRGGKNLEASDLCAIIAIDSGAESPSFADIRDILAGRIGFIPALQERIEYAPGDLTYPHWVRDPEPARNKITEAVGATWQDVLDHVVEASANPVDPTQSAWRMVIWRNLRGVPDVAGHATIVFLQVAHVLTDGRGITQIQRALFGDDSAAARIPGHGNPTPRLGLRESIGELSAVPRNLWNANRQARKLTKKRPASPPPEIESIEPLNATGERRSFLDISIFSRADLRWAGTVTQTGLTAVSLAMETYLAELDALPESGALFAQVPVVPDGIADSDLPVPSANVASASVLVDLGIGIEDLNERVERIQESLRKGLADKPDDEHLAERQLFEQLPVQVVRSNAEQNLRTTPTSPICHTNFTSYPKGPADLSLLGGRVVFIGGPPLLRRNMGLTQAMVGLGDRVAVCITASDTVPRPELYAELLHAAIRREI
ncbi:WS/DGAT domain-containing protein [Smaragdicoccus niigatensis]|uniref:WS/DGAT domain-containing protein n=1 Tax=Smaragdicoccus niigatensis TaxID=359359 RepID=UPI000370FD9E|nr:WS/DGAT domain-containing protein [Smaragdicoccus niigatensis]